MREAAKLYGVEALITDDYLEVEAKIAELEPELVLGTQMERHIAKRLGIPCAVISAPVHVQDFPARYSPQMGFEGANVIFDTFVHPLMMGLEEHLLGLFRDDREFHDDAAPSHLVAPRRVAGRRSRRRRDGRSCAVVDDRVGAATPRRSWPKFRFSSAARLAATPNASPGARRRHHHHRDLVRCQSAFRPLTRHPIRVVVVTMDSHLAGAAARARDTLRRELPGLELDVHAADEWGSDPAALKRCLDDIARGDIVIATMLFLEDHIRAVMPALAARRDACDAMVCSMSAGEVVKLTRLGRFSMSEEAIGAIGWLKRLRGKRARRRSSGHGQMKMLRQLPRLLRFIPARRRTFGRISCRCNIGSRARKRISANLVRMLIERYADGPRAHLRGTTCAPRRPSEYPDVGLYHPRARQRVSRTARTPAAQGEQRRGRAADDALLCAGRQRRRTMTASSPRLRPRDCA